MSHRDLLDATSQTGMLAWALVCVLAFTVLTVLMVRLRNRRLFSAAERSTTDLLGGDGPLAEVLWEQQQVRALGSSDSSRLLDARSAHDVVQLLHEVDGLEPKRQEFAIAMARAQQVEESARLVTSGVNAAVPVVDARQLFMTSPAGTGRRVGLVVFL